MNMELHGMSHWKSVWSAGSWVNSDEPDIVCIVAGVIIDQDDCTVCEGKK